MQLPCYCYCLTYLILCYLLLLYLQHVVIVQEIIEEADIDKNGLIDYSEFLTMMQSPGRA